jgi:hypothetical protein
MSKVDNDATQIFSDNISSDITPEKVKSSKTLKKPIMMASGGLLAGFGVNELINNGTVEGEIATDVSENKLGEAELVEVFDIIESDDTQNFSDAFADARQELGAGGVFEWNGDLYNTYYAEEWDELNPEQIDNFAEAVEVAAEEHEPIIEPIFEEPLDPEPIVIEEPDTLDNDYLIDEVIEEPVLVEINENDSLGEEEIIEVEVVADEVVTPVLEEELISETFENEGELQNDITPINPDNIEGETIEPAPNLVADDDPNRENQEEDNDWNDFIAEEEESNYDDMPDLDNDADVSDFVA